MDLVGYSQEVFERISADYPAFAAKLDLPDIHFIPMSALKGDNVVDPSATHAVVHGRAAARTTSRPCTSPATGT